MNSFSSGPKKSGSGFLGNFGNGSKKGSIQSVGSLESLNKVQANILVADTNFMLIFANQRAVHTLELIKEEIYNEFGVSNNEMVGGSIHRFHKDPTRIERILRNPAALPHTAEFTFGGVTLAQL